MPGLNALFWKHRKLATFLSRPYLWLLLTLFTTNRFNFRCKENTQKTFWAKWTYWVLDCRHLRENLWYNWHSKLECLHHHYIIKENCWIVTFVQQLWFTDSFMQIVKQNLILWIGTFMWRRREKSVPYWFCLAMKLCIIWVSVWILRMTSTGL